MKILVTGASGMLGTDLVKALSGIGAVTAVDIEDLDIRDSSASSKLAADIRPGWIVNCAAYTAVDKCEQCSGEAMAVNATGAENMALAAAMINARFLQISTDYVFDGKKVEPYTEDDQVNPLSSYGRSKCEGEKRVLDILGNKALIVRTAWLFGPHGANFLETILRIAQTHSRIKVINDQTGCPTFTQDLASGICRLIRKDAGGIVHLTNSGYTTWCGFATCFLGVVKPDVEVIPIPTEEYPLPAPRPKYSVLAQEKYRNITGNILPHWKDAVHRYAAVKHSVLVKEFLQ